MLDLQLQQQEQSVIKFLKCATCGACCCEGSRSENTNRINEALAKERRFGTAYPIQLESCYSVLENCYSQFQKD